MWSELMALMARVSPWRLLALYFGGLAIIFLSDNWRAVLRTSHGSALNIREPVVLSMMIFLLAAIGPRMVDRIAREREAALRFEATRARTGEILPPTLPPKPDHGTQESTHIAEKQ